MAWDPTFDWEDPDSFRGEARKYSILTEIATQLNIKCTDVSEPTAALPQLGYPMGYVNDLNTKLDALLPSYVDIINREMSYLDLVRLEAILGTRPSGVFGGSLINWYYKAINLLIFATFSYYGEDWDGVEYNSAVVNDANYSRRWQNVLFYPGKPPYILSGKLYIPTDSLSIFLQLRQFVNHNPDDPARDLDIDNRTYEFDMNTEAINGEGSIVQVLFGNNFKILIQRNRFLVYLGAWVSVGTSGYTNGTWKFAFYPDTGGIRRDVYFNGSLEFSQVSALTASDIQFGIGGDGSGANDSVLEVGPISVTNSLLNKVEFYPESVGL